MATIFGVAYKVDSSGLKKAQSEFEKFSKGLKSTLGALGIGYGLSEVASQLRDAVKAASDDAKGQKLLAEQLRNTANATDLQIQSVENAISSMSIATAVADDQLRPAMASLVRATGDVARSQDLLALSLDVSAATGKDLESVSLAIGKAVSGQTTALFRMVPGLKDSSDWMGKLRSETKGMAEAAGAADPYMQIKVIFDELQESIGYYLLPALKDLAAFMRSSDFNAAVTGAFANFDALDKAVTNLSKVIPTLQGNMEGLWRFIGSTLTTTVFTNIASQFNIVMAMAERLQGFNADRSNNAAASRLTAAAQAWQASQVSKGSSGGTDLRPLNPKPGQVYTFMNYADGANAPAVWWTQTWTGKTWTKAKRMTYTTSSGKSSGASAAQQAADALAKRIQDIKDFKATVATNLEGLIPEARVMTEMGDFQRKVVDGFDAIAQSMQDAFDNKLITADALAVFQKYAAGEQAALTQIAKARDVLTKKIDIAKQLTQSVRDMGNITTAINKQTEQVTETYTKVIDGVNVTISKTMEVAKATDLVASYKAIIDKTKTFAANLKALKAAGLNGQLFAQIVSAGIDAGGETAAAIVAGGADVIASLNDLFGQLDATAADVAKTSTDILYQTGLDVTNGFIEGLLAQDSALQNAATTLAQNFNDAFKAALNIAVPSSGAAGGTVAQITAPFVTGGVPGSSESGTALGNQIVEQVLNPIKTGADQIAASFDTSGIVAAGGFMPSNYGTGAAGSVQGAVIDATTIAKQIKANTNSNLSVTYFTKAVTNAMNGLEGSTATMQKWTNIASNYLQSAMTAAQPTFGAASVSPTYNLTVNAGMGTDGQNVGLSIVQALKQYERTNGAVWVSA